PLFNHRFPAVVLTLLSLLLPIAAMSQTNPNSVAILHWYRANRITTFSVAGPTGLAFDGSDLWVTNSGANTVTRLRINDGTVLGTAPTGTGPRALAFDGANMWVVNQTSNNVTKIRCSDRAVLGTFNVGTSPVWAVFDGANIWVSNNGSNNV